MERLLVKTALGPHKPPFSCKGAIVYRLAAPGADHYFLLNEGPARKVKLDVRSVRYRAVADPVSGERVSLTAIAIEADGGRWIRCEK
jgi:beta-galactosidase